MSDNGSQRPPPNYNRHHHHFAHSNTPANNSPPLHDQYKLASPSRPPPRLEPLYEPFSSHFDPLDRYDHFEPLASPPPGRPSQSRLLPPPPPSFRDILNPVGPQERTYKRIAVPSEAAALPQAQFSPPPPSFGSPPRRYKPLGPALSPSTGLNSPSTFPGPTFSPPTPSSSVGRNRYIDLTTPQTSASTSATSASSTPGSISAMPPRRVVKPRPYIPLVDSDDSDEEGPSTKRRRLNSNVDVNTKPVIEINLTDDSINPLEAALQKQQAEAVKAQQADGEKPRGLKTLTCVICLDTPKDLTATSCGHVFCHECLVNALIAGENRSRGRGEPKKSQCPVCRKTIHRSKTNDVVPLLMKKARATQPRRLMKQAIT